MDYAFIYLSNKIEILYQGLKNSLFFKGADPFAKRLIIVPSPAMKGYLRRQMAEDSELQISFGLEFAFLDQGLELLKSSLGCDKKKRIPSIFELSIIIENELTTILKNEAEQPLWQPLITYYNEAKAKKRILKTSWLSDELARLFSTYSEYGSKMALEWEANGVNSANDWQAELWRRIYCQKNFTALFHSFEYDFQKETGYQEIHLFGLSFISELKNQFLKKVSEVIPVYSWFLSPCQKLWSDIRSDKESNAISSFWLNDEIPLGNLENLVQLLRDRNPLLANFGKLGRHMAQSFEDHYHQTHGHYEINEAVSHFPDYESLIGTDMTVAEGKLTLLNAIQADLALLRVPRETIELPGDLSIQIHSSSSILREVENVYQILLRTIHESKEAIEPHEIIIMAPEITDYAPYINMVFGHKDSQLDYQIMDLKLLSKGELTQAFVQLVQLAQSKWKMEEILKLLSYPFFAKKQELDPEELVELKKWLEKQEITWGLTNHHRTELLQKDGFKPLLESSEKGTWQEAIDSLLMGMVYQVNEEEESQVLELPFLPKEKIDLSKADLLGKLIRFIKVLEKDLLPLSLENNKTMQDWGIYLKNLFEQYFVIEFNNEQLCEEQETIIKTLSRLQKSADEIPESTFTASSVLERLQSLFESKEYCYREKHFQALRFSSLLPMRAVPAKIVLLMGLNLDIYPRKEKRSSLDRLISFPEKDYYPSQTDYDRYLFLEALLSARHAFIISYVAKGVSSGSKSPPSTLVSEFLDYIDASYSFGGDKPSSKIIFEHPFFAFDKLYFTGDGKFKSYSRSNYQAALTYYSAKKEGPSFLKEFSFSNEFLEKDSVEAVELKALQQLAKHPLQSYLNKTLGIYLNQIEDEQSGFELSSLNRYFLKQKSLKQSTEAILAYADKKRSWPYAPFDLLAKKSIREDILEIEEALQCFSLKKEDLIDCELSLGCCEAQLKQNTLLLPPIEVLTKYGLIKLVGKLPPISKQGFLVFGKKDFKNAIRNYPSALLFSALPNGYFEKQFLFLDKGIKIPAFEEPALLLNEFLHYYFLAHRTISPLMPEWVSPILEGSAEKLQTAMGSTYNDPFRGFQDPYAKWVFHEEALPDAKTIIDNWQSFTEGLYGPLQKMWDLK